MYFRLIFECLKVQHTWKIVRNIFGFDVKWKQIVIGFYSVRNETTAMYNLLSSFVALKIYKYKMLYRLENIVETSKGIVCNLKLCIHNTYKFYIVSEILDIILSSKGSWINCT